MGWEDVGRGGTVKGSRIYYTATFYDLYLSVELGFLA